MPNVTVTIDGVSKTVPAGSTPHPVLAKSANASPHVPRLHIAALNQVFSAGDNITINGNEVITSGLN